MNITTTAEPVRLEHIFNLWQAEDGWRGSCAAHGAHTAHNRLRREAKADLVASCSARHVVSYLTNLENMTRDLVNNPDDGWARLYLRNALTDLEAHGVDEAHPEVLEARMALS